MKIGIIASGGNSPAMNNAVIALVKYGQLNGIEVVLIKDGYKGVLAKEFVKPELAWLNEFNSRGNVWIRSARCQEFFDDKYKIIAANNLKEANIDILVVIGGDGSYNGAALLSKLTGQKVVCLPGTIDNDISSTEYSIGFDTCLQQIVTSTDAARDSFESHSGIGFIEVMGRHFSDLAIKASIALNATYVVTEDFIPTAAQFAELHRKNLESGEKYSLFIITENIYGKDGRPTLQDIAKEVGELTNNSMSRVQVLGYLQRGGTPTAFDRFQTMRMGEFAIECIKNNIFNISVGIKNDQLIYTDIQEAVSMPRKKHDLYFLKKYPII